MSPSSFSGWNEESKSLSLTLRLRTAMSYALESKKRKFDRILESLTDGSSQAKAPAEPRTSLSSRNNVSITSKFGSLDSSKKRRVSPSLSKSISHRSLIGHYLPSSRAAFLERLETYRHITQWHIPSTSPANAAEWAKRGWICADVDTVSCSACLERVTVDLNIEKTSRMANTQDEGDESQDVNVPQNEEEQDVEIQVQEALVKRYYEMITTSHAENCPWKKRGCDPSIQRIEGLLTTSNALSSTRSRYESIVDKIHDFPTVSDLPSYDILPAPHLEDYDGLTETPLQRDAFKLAVCGWQYKSEDVIECKHCFRSLGLWLYRGDNPTVEHLDAVESHLEYCPWISPESQDTELVVHPNAVDGSGKRLRLPAWALVCHAVKKQSLRKQGQQSHTYAERSHGVDDGSAREQLSPEQRDKRMKDLMRRIKEIKKPFNVKGLLRKKDQAG